MRREIAGLGLLLSGLHVAVASASSGDPVAPPFTKSALGGGEVSLSDHAGDVVVLFLLGYG